VFARSHATNPTYTYTEKETIKMTNAKTAPLRTVTRFGSLGTTLAEDYTINSIATAMRDARGESVKITVLSENDLGIKVVA
jgi:hypothetical protein